MAVNAVYRASVIRSLLPKRSERLMDVGCGPITAAYTFADSAALITCVDWKLRVYGSIPANVECFEGDFIELDLPKNAFDAIIASDVFEHVLLEQEPIFVNKCISALKPGGHMVISVPNLGTFACLDPYRVKPAMYYVLWRLGLFKPNHNGSCDIRKGHKHYRVEELSEKFYPLQLVETVYYGYFFDPLLTWAVALSRGSGRFPFYTCLEHACLREFDRDYGERSFNVALKFRKSTYIDLSPGISSKNE